MIKKISELKGVIINGAKMVSHESGITIGEKLNEVIDHINALEQEKTTATKPRIVHKEPLVHGGMKYKCQSCGKEWFMCLEIGVEDFGKNGRQHQPCPFCIMCECGGFAHDISGILTLPDVRPLLPGMKYFAYDKSGKEDACGIKSIYVPDPPTESEEVNELRQRLNEIKAKVKSEEAKWLVKEIPKQGKKFLICSECDKTIDCNVCQIDENEFDFCPYCGADMRKGGADNGKA